MTSKEIKARFSQNLRALRKARGLTQEALADAASLSLQAVNDIECGRRWPRVETLALFSAALCCDVDSFFQSSAAVKCQKAAVRAEIHSAISLSLKKMQSEIDEIFTGQ